MIALFGCPVICTDINSQCYFIHKHLNYARNNKDHWQTGRQYLGTADSDEMKKMVVTLSKAQKFKHSFLGLQ